MKILFVSMPHPTHFHPMLPLAWALRSAGHEVRVAYHPDLVDTATGAGMTAVPVGRPGWYREDVHEPELYARLMGNGASDHLRTFDWDGKDPDAWSWEGLLGLEKVIVSALLAGISNDPFVEELIAYAEHWRPDLVIWEQLTLGGAVAAEVLGVPHARFLYGLDFIGRAREEFVRLHEGFKTPHTGKTPPESGWSRSSSGSGASGPSGCASVASPSPPPCPVRNWTWPGRRSACATSPTTDRRWCRSGCVGPRNGAGSA